jgi:pyruvate kinase
MDAGMNVARLNFSHGTHEHHAKTIQRLKEARAELGQPLAIMLDTKGPEIRVGKLQHGKVELKKGQSLALVDSSIEGDSSQIPIDPASVLQKLPLGTKVLFDDGYISSEIIENSSEKTLVKVINEGTVKSGKGVNIPNVSLGLPALTERDVQDIRFGVEHDVDIIAASFIRTADHVLSIKKLLSELGSPEILLVAKIENGEGVQNFDTIVQVADGIMIARGDLGVEVPLSQVPRLQKMMIHKCCLAGKPSVTATQMLESMIHNPRPTRAEASDVANAIYDSTSLVMLSGETAVGAYPIEAVRVMKSIIRESERDFNNQDFFQHHSHLVYHDVPSAVTVATVKTAYSSAAKAIFAFTSSGSTARLLARLRPQMPILALTPVKKNYQQLAFSWGVTPFFYPAASSIEDSFTRASGLALDTGLVQYGDLVVVTAGTPFGVAGTTNMMMVENIGNVLVRGHQCSGERVYGKVAILFYPDKDRLYSIKDHIIVITKCDDSYLPFVKSAKGIILQNGVDDTESESYVLLVSKTLNKPAIVRADAACNVLKEGQLVTLDPAQGRVYKGAVISET